MVNAWPPPLDSPGPHPTTLAEAALGIVAAPAPPTKVALALNTSQRWTRRQLTLDRNAELQLPDAPGRPERPILTAPRNVPKRGTKTRQQRHALLHALAHIELNAIDMAWDLVARFAHLELPLAFFDDWVSVGKEEAEHFQALSERLTALGSAYGAMPAHDGLWQAAAATSGNLLARLAVVPLVLEARGLDVTPMMISRMTASGDCESAEILKRIYNDEKGHVAIGLRWFRYLCQRQNLPVEQTYQQLVRTYFKGAIKPPFNHHARNTAGLTPTFYLALAAPTSKPGPAGTD